MSDMGSSQDDTTPKALGHEAGTLHLTEQNMAEIIAKGHTQVNGKRITVPLGKWQSFEITPEEESPSIADKISKITGIAPTSDQTSKLVSLFIALQIQHDTALYKTLEAALPEKYGADGVPNYDEPVLAIIDQMREAIDDMERNLEQS